MGSLGVAKDDRETDCITSVFFIVMVYLFCFVFALLSG